MAAKTPGVYIVETNVFPNSLVEVATAVPAFIGYTGKADNGGKTLHMKPWRISAMAEFLNHFGAAPQARFELKERGAATPLPPGRELVQTEGRYFLYRAMLHFFQNGGGPCYIVSVGDHRQDNAPAAGDLTDGIDALIHEAEPTLLVAPDSGAVELRRLHRRAAGRAGALQHAANALRHTRCLGWPPVRGRQPLHRELPQCAGGDRTRAWRGLPSLASHLGRAGSRPELPELRRPRLADGGHQARTAPARCGGRAHRRASQGPAPRRGRHRQNIGVLESRCRSVVQRR